MRKHFVISLSFLFSSHFLFAQLLVKGKISTQNSENVSFAPVALLQASDSSLVKGVLTNENGDFFILDLDTGIYKINIQHIGFKSKSSHSFTLNHNTPSINLGTLFLEEDIKILSEVTISTQKSLLEYESDRIVLNLENSIITKGNKIQDLLNYAPLVEIDGQNKITVANKERVLILVDGRQLGDKTISNFLKNFSAEDILKIEVITNPSAKYDASYQSVINISTRKKLEEGINGHFSINYSQGERGRFTPDISINYRKSRWNIFAGASYDLSDHLLDQQLNRSFTDAYVDNDIRILNYVNELSSFLGVDFSVNEKHSLGLNLYGDWNNSKANSVSQVAFLTKNYQLDSLFKSVNLDHENNYSYDLNFNYTATFDKPGKELVLNVTQTLFDVHRTQNINFHQINLEGKALNDPSIVRIINPSKQNSFISQVEYSSPLSKGKMEFGTNYIRITNDNVLKQTNVIDKNYQSTPNISMEDIYKESTFGAFINYSHLFNKDWSLMTSLRLENTNQSLTEIGFTKNYLGAFPSASISKEFSKGQQWRLSYSRKINRPDLGSLVPYRNMVDPFTFGEGNPYLKPQFINSIDSYFNLGTISLFANYTFNQNIISPILYT